MKCGYLYLSPSIFFMKGSMKVQLTASMLFYLAVLIGVCGFFGFAFFLTDSCVTMEEMKRTLL